MTRTFTCGLMLAASLFAVNAGAQTTQLAPWFDSNGFYNKAGVDKDRLLTDLTTCRAEAVRVKTVRGTRTGFVSASAFTADGRYDPAVSGAATLISNVIFAIQDASYAESLEPKEFRDCMVSMDYRRFTMGATDRSKHNATPDQGFSALVAAESPAEGKPYTGGIYDNYYLPDLTAAPYPNATPEATPDAQGAYRPIPPVLPATPLPPQAVGIRFDVPGDLQPVTPGALAVPKEGAAIVVVSARQNAKTAADWVARFAFKRVSNDGQFLDLVKDDTHFSVLSFMSGMGIKDKTLKGDISKSRYSTFEIPAGRYVLTTMGPINTCLSTLTFEVKSGEALYLGDLVFRNAGMAFSTMFNPFSNMRKDMDGDLKESDRMAIGSDIEAARTAMLAGDDVKAQLKPVAYQNGYRIPCDGRYIGRVRNPAWSDFNPEQATAFNAVLVEKVNESAKAK